MVLNPTHPKTITLPIPHHASQIPMQTTTNILGQKRPSILRTKHNVNQHETQRLGHAEDYKLTLLSRNFCACKLIPACLLLLFSLTPARAQSTTIRIRFENGKNGKPLAVKYIKVGGGPYDLPDYRVEKVEKNAMIVTFKNKQTFAFANDGYYRCDTTSQSAPPMQFNLHEVAERGFVAPNICGKVRARPTPGELVIYSRRAHIWEALGNLRGLFICG